MPTPEELAAQAKEIAGVNYDALRASGTTDEQIVAGAQRPSEKPDNAPATEEDVADAADKMAEPTEDPQPGATHEQVGSAFPTSERPDAASGPAPEVEEAADDSEVEPPMGGDVPAPVAQFEEVDTNDLLDEVYKRAPLRLAVQRRFLQAKIRGDIRKHLKTSLDVIEILVGAEGVGLVKHMIVEKNSIPLR